MDKNTFTQICRTTENLLNPTFQEKSMIWYKCQSATDNAVDVGFYFKNKWNFLYDDIMSPIDSLKQTQFVIEAGANISFTQSQTPAGITKYTINAGDSFPEVPNDRKNYLRTYENWVEGLAKSEYNSYVLMEQTNVYFGASIFNTGQPYFHYKIYSDVTFTIDKTDFNGIHIKNLLIENTSNFSINITIARGAGFSSGQKLINMYGDNPITIQPKSFLELVITYWTDDRVTYNGGLAVNEIL